MKKIEYILFYRVDKNGVCGDVRGDVRGGVRGGVRVSALWRVNLNFRLFKKFELING